MENKDIEQLETSSFRDPDAKVFLKDGEIYRRISKNYAKTFEKFINSGLYEKLLSENRHMGGQQERDGCAVQSGRGDHAGNL